MGTKSRLEKWEGSEKEPGFVEGEGQQSAWVGFGAGHLRAKLEKAERFGNGSAHCPVGITRHKSTRRSQKGGK